MQELISSQESKQMYERLKTWLQKLLPEEWDKYDLRASIDSTLSYSENKEKIREDLKLLMDNLEEQKKEAETDQEEIIHERKIQAEKEVEDWNNSISYDENKKVDGFYIKVHRAIDKISQGFSQLAFIKGPPGIGKSFQIRKRFKHNNENFVEITGEVTEAYLYRLIYENNGKILWLKDVVKLLSGQKSINLLKSATETETDKILTKSNYSKDQDDLPNKFLCKCKFVFDYNTLSNMPLREDFEALVSRGDFIELSMSEGEIQSIMRLLAKSSDEKRVTEFIISNFKSNGLCRFNLRTQWKAMKTYAFAEQNKYDWKKELKRELETVTKTRAMLYSFMGKSAMRTGNLKKILLKYGVVNSLRTAHRKINEWVYIDELYRHSEEDRNFFVCLNPKRGDGNAQIIE